MHHRRADSESVVFVPMISKFPEVETTLHFAHKDSISYHKEPNILAGLNTKFLASIWE